MLCVSNHFDCAVLSASNRTYTTYTGTRNELNRRTLTCKFQRADTHSTHSSAENRIRGIEFDYYCFSVVRLLGWRSKRKQRERRIERGRERERASERERAWEKKPAEIHINVVGRLMIEYWKRETDSNKSIRCVAVEWPIKCKRRFKFFSRYFCISISLLRWCGWLASEWASKGKKGGAGGGEEWTNETISNKWM